MINQFIEKLLSNPNFKGQPLTLVEIHISNFVMQNLANLGPMLVGPQFYPNTSPQEAAEKLIGQIRRLIASQVLQKTNRLLSSSIDFDIHKKLAGHFDISADELQNSFKAFYEKIIGHREARQKIEQLAIILEENLIDKYLFAAFSEKGYIYNEMFRVEKHHFDVAILKEYLKVSAALLPGYYVKLNALELGATGANAQDIGETPLELKKFFDKADQIMKALVQQLHEDFWETSKNSCYNYKEHPSQDPGGKLLRILFMRARDQRSGLKIEKGAETPDKSWFSIQVRNANHSGLDKDMLENLNRLAFSLRY